MPRPRYDSFVASIAMYPRSGPTPRCGSSLPTTTPTSSPAGLEACLRQRAGQEGGRGERDHVAEITPLIQEVAVHVDTVGLAEIGGDHAADRFQLRGLLRWIVAVVVDFFFFGFGGWCAPRFWGGRWR
jgi:hypothetical protein